MAEIYALTCPDKRLVSHIRDSRRRNTPVYCWIRKLLKQGKTPGFRILEIAHEWEEAERRLIALSRVRGDRLLNVADGGVEPYCPTEIRAANGKRTADMRATDPIKHTAHKLLQKIGELKFYAIKIGKHALVEKLECAAQKLRGMNQEELFWLVFSKPNIHWALSTHARKYASKYWSNV